MPGQSEKKISKGKDKNAVKLIYIICVCVLKKTRFRIIEYTEEQLEKENQTIRITKCFLE